jgi:hypothetical protein
VAGRRECRLTRRWCRRRRRMRRAARATGADATRLESAPHVSPKGEKQSSIPLVTNISRDMLLGSGNLAVFESPLMSDLHTPACASMQRPVALDAPALVGASTPDFRAASVGWREVESRCNPQSPPQPVAVLHATRRGRLHPHLSPRPCVASGRRSFRPSARHRRSRGDLST